MNKGIVGVVSVVAFALFGCTGAFCDAPGEAKKEAVGAPPVAASKPAPAADAASTQAGGCTGVRGEEIGGRFHYGVFPANG